jgi:hypothetical protein
MQGRRFSSVAMACSAFCGGEHVEVVSGQGFAQDPQQLDVVVDDKHGVTQVSDIRGRTGNEIHVQPSQPQVGLDALQDLLLVKWLADVVVAASAKCLDLVVASLEAR